MNILPYDHLKLVLESYHGLQCALELHRLAAFPLGSVVHVECSRYSGYGIASTYECHHHELGVRLENGNVWHYGMDGIVPAPDRKLWPNWIKRSLRKRKTKC